MATKSQTLMDYVYWDNTGWTRTQATSIVKLRQKLIRNKSHYAKPKKSWEVKWGKKLATLTYVGPNWTWTTYTDIEAHPIIRNVVAVYDVNPDGTLGKKHKE